MFILPLYSDKKKCIQFVNMVYYKKSNYNQYNHCNHISSTVCFMVQSKVASLRRNIDHLFWWELSLFSKCHFAFLSLRSFDLWCGSFKTKFEKKKICFHIFRRQHYMIIGWVNRFNTSSTWLLNVSGSTVTALVDCFVDRKDHLKHS